jgi:protein-L-isoaspartate(D-aspartate) O-methyltransferase
MRPKFSSNDKLVDYLVKQNRIESDDVEDAFRRVDRREFVPDEHSGDAYADRPIPIDGVTVSAPHMVAVVTELLELSGDEEVLEIGSGSGYQAAILGEIVEKVVGVEIDEKLAKKSRGRVPENVEIRIGNGFDVIDEEFDRILFSCATQDFETAKNYLKEDCIIVGPIIQQNHQVVKKWKNGESTNHCRVGYVEMQS